MTKNKFSIYRILLRGLLIMCLGFLMACREDPAKLSNKIYEMNNVESIAYREGMTVTGKVEQIETEFIRKEGKTYMFSLGFHPTTDNIAEFEQILINDFDGEIEIFQKGKPHSIIKYHDFESFTWSPNKDTYGPVYYLTIDSNDTNYSFKPKIRAKKTCTYSFSFQPIKTKDILPSRTIENLKPKNETIDIPAVMNRIDMYMEKKGRHVLCFGLHFPAQFNSQGERDFINEWYLVSDLMRNEYDGSIKLYKNGNPYVVMRYDDIANGSTGYNGLWGDHDDESVIAKAYFFYIDEPGMYSFVPEMKSGKKFEFSLSIQYVHRRK